MAGEWQRSLSFTARFDNITNISLACSQTHTDAGSKAHLRARELESTAFKESADEQEYEARIKNILQELGINVKDEACATICTERAEDIARRTLDACRTKTKIGDYHDAAPFAHGLFSVVYVAQHPDFDRQSSAEQHKFMDSLVAIKATKLDMIQPPHDAAREIRILQHARSPSVMPLVSHFYDGKGHLMMVMPFMPITLGQLLDTEAERQTIKNIKADEHVVPNYLKRVLQDVFRALQYIHGVDIIHRDVKPSNILLQSPVGPAYLADFGIAWHATDGGSEPRDNKISDVGTTCYRAPEILFGDIAYDKKLDIWAAGCVVAELLLAGRRGALFDAGDAGSELTLILDIFQTLGTPTQDVWPELSRVPDWGKMHFRDFPARPWSAILPACDDSGRSLVAQLVRYSQAERLNAKEILCHAFFDGVAS